MKYYFFIRKIINFLIPKHKERIYTFPHINGKNDKYDLLNYSSDNLLCILNFFKDNDIAKNYVIYVECYSQDRLKLLADTVKKWNCDVRPLLSDQIKENTNHSFRRKWKNRLIRYSCKTWISCTPHAGFEDKLKCQKYFCVSYSTPLKSAMINSTEWNLEHIDAFFEPSLLSASVHAAQFRNYLSKAPIIGFPRNDTLLEHPKKNEVESWLKEKGFSLETDHILIYAPTYREYEGAYEGKCVLGYDISNEELEEYLSLNHYILIVKFHPLQTIEKIEGFSRIIKYETNYSFSLYDLLAESSLLISDYSSVIHDFIITGKPVVIDAFDYEKYDNSRGFAFDPVDIVLPGEVCKTFKEFSITTREEMESNIRKDKYYLVQKMFHKYIDSNSTNRAADFIINKIEE